jgi:hypothetical protein
MRSATKVTKQTAQQIAKQLAWQSHEAVGEAKKQLVGETNSSAPQPQPEKNTTPIDEAKIKAETIQRYQQLNSQIQQIVKEKEQVELEKKAREEYHKQELIQKTQALDNTVEISTKRSRRMGGQKAQLEKMQKKSEIRMPPSG